jgi:hypothetical protein
MSSEEKPRKNPDQDQKVIEKEEQLTDEQLDEVSGGMAEAGNKRGEEQDTKRSA